MAIEVWTTGAGVPGLAARHAAAAEAAGYDGLALVDSQNLAGDCYVGLALAAKATTRLRLATGVTNPVTRHPAATAAAIAAIHAESGGRAVLGIGRGDSSLAHLGYAPAPVPVFAHALERIQGYLRGEEVALRARREPRDRSAWRRLRRRAVSRGSRPDLPKVPVDVAATGPKMIEIGATRAERVSFAVGADPARIRWAIDTCAQRAPRGRPRPRRRLARRVGERGGARRPRGRKGARRGRRGALRALLRDARRARGPRLGGGSRAACAACTTPTT